MKERGSTKTAAMIRLPRDDEGDYPRALELTALGILSKVATERSWLMGRPFEIADAKALLRHLEVALTAVPKRYVDGGAEEGLAKICIASLPSGNIEFTVEGTLTETPRWIFQMTEAGGRALRASLDTVLVGSETA
jgi:hypothetical protein